MPAWRTQGTWQHTVVAGAGFCVAVGGLMWAVEELRAYSTKRQIKATVQGSMEGLGKEWIGGEAMVQSVKGGVDVKLSSGGIEVRQVGWKGTTGCRRVI